MGTTTSAAANTFPAGRRGRDRLFDPINLVLLPTVAMLLVARHFGMISSQPTWRICGSVLIAHVSGVLFAARFPPGTNRSKPGVFLAFTIGLGGLFLYTIGWGAVLAVTFIASAAVVIEADGSHHGRTAILTTLATILVGELCVALGVFPSMVAEPTGHGIAVLEAAVTVTVIALLARGQRDKELMEEQKQLGEERFRALVQHASDAILIIEDGGAVKYASPAVESLFGCPPEQLETLDISWIDEDHADAITMLFHELKSRPGAVEVADVPIRRVDGSSRWVEVHVTNLIDTPAVGGYVCNMRDIGARRSAHLQLVHDAQHDALPHLANRRLFLERLDRAWTDTTSPTGTIAVLFIDVDHFKDINDRLGHAVGDQALLTIANALSALLRPSDLVARFGGDEFAVLLDPMPDIAGALEVAERIRAELSGCTNVDGHELTLAVSVGVATSHDARSASELLENSDEAMYRAKRNGRSRCETYAARSPRLSYAASRPGRVAETEHASW